MVDASHLLVFAAWDDYTPERINHMFDLTNEVRGFRNEGWEAYRQQLLSTYPGRGSQVNFAHAARQAYIGFGAAIIAAAFEEVDCTPMEGFDPAAVDRILNLGERGLRSAGMKERGDEVGIQTPSDLHSFFLGTRAILENKDKGRWKLQQNMGGKAASVHFDAKKANKCELASFIIRSK